MNTPDMTPSQLALHKSIYRDLTQFVSYDEAFELATLSVFRKF